MPDESPAPLTALLFARPELSARMMAHLHMASERRIHIATFLPIFNRARAIHVLQQLAPQIVFLDAEVEGSNLAHMLELRQHTTSPFVVVGLAPAGSGLMEEMLSVGLDAVYALPLSPASYDRLDAELPAKFEAAARAWGKGAWGAAAPESIQAATAAAGGTPWQRQAIAVWSPKGGVGKTVVACELAAMLSAIGGREVALVDANMNGGHIKLRLNVETDSSLLTAAATFQSHHGHPSLESDAVVRLQHCLTPLPGTANLKVLAGVGNMDQSLHESVVGEAGLAFMDWLLPTLKRSVDFVILDLGSSINVGVHYGALKNVDFILALCEPDLTSVADIREGVRSNLLGQNGINLNRFGLVINKWQDGLGVSLREAARFAGISSMGIIPHDPSGNITLAGNEGQSYVARFANRRNNPPATESTLHGLASVAGQFYPPIAAAWSARLQRSGRKRLFGRG